MYLEKQIDLIYKSAFCAGLVLLIVDLPLSYILPVELSFENGLIENAQVAVLILNCIINFMIMNKTNDKSARNFNIWCILLSIILICRELSWGRVFYPTGVIESTGPIFIPMSNFVWRTEVHIFIVVYSLILIGFTISKLPIKNLLRCRPPFMVILMMALGALLEYIGDNKIGFDKYQGQIIEEIGELAFYTFIPALCIYYYRKLSK